MKTIHIIVEAGEDKGKEISVPPEGIRLGRSSKNDVVLVDPLLSRHHCRLYFKQGIGLSVSDLGSSNRTMVNKVEITEQPLKLGDAVQVGDTVMRVVNDGSGVSAKPSVVDLGLAPKVISNAANPTGQKKLGVGKLLAVASVAFIVAILLCIPKLLSTGKTKGTDEPVVAKIEKKTLAIDYEKVEADENNIFRYKLTLTPDLNISIEIDDLINNRTVRKEKKVDEELIANLVRYIENADFFTLKPEYAGVRPGVFNQMDLSITIGRKTHSTRVLNRPEPEIFKDVRGKLEVYGKNELGLWAIQFSTEKLLEMAEDEYLLGKKLFDEREVKYSNLSDALSNFQKSEIDLETVEPKPDFYADTILCIRDCKQLLQEKHDELYFQAERSKKLEQWADAATNLRIIQEIIPDRADDRNKQARKELLDVEERLKANN